MTPDIITVLICDCGIDFCGQVSFISHRWQASSRWGPASLTLTRRTTKPERERQPMKVCLQKKKNVTHVISVTWLESNHVFRWRFLPGWSWGWSQGHHGKVSPTSSRTCTNSRVYRLFIQMSLSPCRWGSLVLSRSRRGRGESSRTSSSRRSRQKNPGFTCTTTVPR